MTFAPLPNIMVAPNGARKTKKDHPAVPITIAETVATAKACFDAGAQAIHAHVRDSEDQHILDAGLYSELLAELKIAVPQMMAQITTEAVGRYSPPEQIALVKDVHPHAVSVGLREMIPGDDTKEAKEFYHWADEAEVLVQHILYDTNDVSRLAQAQENGVIPAGPLQVLFVLGRYTEDQESLPADLDPFLSTFAETKLDADWAICAFGHAETTCLAKAFSLGGKARVGFENSLWNENGEIAKDNVERVAEVANRFATSVKS